MHIIDFLLMLLVAGICGSIGFAMVSRSSASCLGAIVLGFIGALVGTGLARLTNLPDFLNVRIGGRPFPIVWSVIGSALFVALLNLIARKKIVD